MKTTIKMTQEIELPCEFMKQLGDNDGVLCLIHFLSETRHEYIFEYDRGLRECSNDVLLNKKLVPSSAEEWNARIDTLLSEISERKVEL